MINIDRGRCAYCGGCVSVCPVEALTLAETRIIVDASCTDCGDCELACPMGALQSEGVLQAGKAPRRNYDLVVVGAGPGGAVAARVAAQQGLTVLLLEKRQEIGSPVRCAEGVWREELTPFIRPDPAWIAAEVTRGQMTALIGGKAQTWRVEGELGYILERRIFDRVLAERAAQAGAEVRVKTAAVGLLQEGGKVRGVRIRSGGLETEVQASVVIAADGVESQVGRWAGLDTLLPLKDTMVCTQYLMAGIDIDPTCIQFYLGCEWAPGGYGWIFPKGDGRANVGLGVQADVWPAIAAHHASERPDTEGAGTVLAFLTRFIEQHPFLAQGYPVTLVAGNVPVALPPAAMATEGLMLVGDAARQVNPLTGGGIGNAMRAGKLAAETAASAIAAGDTSARYLARYEQAWRRTTGRKMARNYRLRQRFPPAQRDNERFAHTFLLAAGQ